MATNAFNNFVSTLNKKPTSGTSLSSLNTGNTLSSFRQSTPTPVRSPISNISATNTNATNITGPTQSIGGSTTRINNFSPAKQNYVSSITPTQTYGTNSGSPVITPPPTQTPVPTPTPTPTPKKSEGAYIDYLKTLFNPEQVKLAQQSKESSLKRASDAQLATDKAQLDARKGYEANLDREGGLKSGAQQSAQVYSRRASDDVADLALAETAAVRTAEIASNTYNTFINAGKSVYEAEVAAAKASADAKNNEDQFTLGEGQVRYDAQGNLIATGLSVKDKDSNTLLTATEAQLLGVPYGTTRSQAYGMSATGKPTAEQSKARQFAVSAKNANDILATVSYSPGKIQLPGPNLLKSGERQQFEQASRAFVNAVLRRESGATITDDEFNNKFRELIDQPGDAAPVKAQKKLARDAAVLSIQEAGGEGTAQSPTQISGSLYEF